MAIRSGDFSEQAEVYARARPGYPAAMLDRLLSRAHVGPGDRVAEFGAGTGLFTRELVERGLEVIAIEPSVAMRDQAGELPGVRWQIGSFEAHELPAGELGWIVAAQAFHWADPARALPKLHRALARQGCFTALWNDRDVPGSPLLEYTFAAIDRRVPEFDEGYRKRDWTSVLTSTGDFDRVELDEIAHVVTMSHARFLDLWRSHNKLNVAAGPIAMASLLDELAAWLRDNAPDPVDVPYRCRAWTAWPTHSR
ncbi:class I SAM-dependent methyltransferase [Nannocystaceae bacterium ST9]